MEPSNFEILVEDSDTGGPSSITVRMEYLFCFWNSDIVNFVCKIDEREEESIVLLIFVLWQCLNRQWVRDCQVGRKSYLGPTEITTFSSRHLSRNNKHDTFWHVISTGYFYVLFL